MHPRALHCSPVGGGGSDRTLGTAKDSFLTLEREREHVLGNILADGFFPFHFNSRVKSGQADSPA